MSEKVSRYLLGCDVYLYPQRVAGRRKCLQEGEKPLPREDKSERKLDDVLTYAQTPACPCQRSSPVVPWLCTLGLTPSSDQQFSNFSTH